MSVDQPDASREPAGPQKAARGGPSGLRGGRMSRRTERYYLLLGLLLVDIFVIGLAGSSKWATFAYTPLTAATLLLALRTSEARRRTMLIAWLAGGLAVIVSVAALISGDVEFNGLIYFMLFALLLMSPLAIGRHIVMSRRVTPRLLVSAICVYLMIGMLFTFVYLGVNGADPNFFAQGVQKDPSIYLYFSFVTMTTVGFGDFTPGAAVPRVLVIFEAMFGQVFLVTAVARMVSLLGPAAELGAAFRDSKDDG